MPFTIHTTPPPYANDIETAVVAEAIRLVELGEITDPDALMDALKAVRAAMCEKLPKRTRNDPHRWSCGMQWAISKGEQQLRIGYRLESLEPSAIVVIPQIF